MSILPDEADVVGEMTTLVNLLGIYDPTVVHVMAERRYGRIRKLRSWASVSTITLLLTNGSNMTGVVGLLKPWLLLAGPTITRSVQYGRPCRPTRARLVRCDGGHVIYVTRYLSPKDTSRILEALRTAAQNSVFNGEGSAYTALLRE